MMTYMTPPLTKAHRVAIIGGGVIGLSLGWRLAQAGRAVTIYERGVPGHGASWAAAGMLAAGIEAEPTEEALFRLGRYSQELWPDFAAAVEAASGHSVGYETTGTLICAFNRDQALKLRQNIDFQRRLGGEFTFLSGNQARELEPSLSASVIGAALSAHDHQADNRKLGPALAVAFTAAGGVLRTHTDAGVVMEGRRAVGILVADDVEPADLVVIAAGPWSRGVAGLPDNARPPVRPIKGQLLAVQMPPGEPLTRHVIWGATCYLVPRSDGRLVIGATTEERGFDTSITAGGMLSLLDDAWRTLPAIEDCPILETWTGFRPGSPDDMPILGPTPIDRLLLATGHHRNGILLTPATMDLMAEFILTGIMPDQMSPFLLERFAK